MSILKQYTPEFRQLSVDEALMDLTGTRRLFGTPKEVAKEIKEKIRSEEGIVLSIGIATNPYVAKLACESGKPDGLVIIEEGREEHFTEGLELKKLWGVGQKTLDRLRELNITTTSKLKALSRNTLQSMLGRGASEFLYNAVRGIDPGFHPQEPKSRSISHEMTFEVDKKHPEALRRFYLELSQQIMSRLIDENLKSRTLFIKIRYSDFSTVTCRKTLKHWISSSDELFHHAHGLFEKKWDGRTPIRLIGIGFSGIETKNVPEQQELFPDAELKQKQVEETVNRIKRKMDKIVLTKASLLKKKKT